MSEQLGEVIRQKAGMVAADIGVELVECRLRREGPRLHVRIDIDRPGTGGIGIEDCKSLSRQLEQELDTDETISGSYLLEVSSPGVDRPIESEDDVRRNTGRRLLVKTRDEDGVEHELYGTLIGGDSSQLVLDEGNGSLVEVPRERIVAARQDISIR